MGSQRGRLGKCVYVFCQLAHVSLALVLLGAAVAEFADESPYFDVLRNPSVGHAQLELFRNVSGQTLQSNFRRVMDLPVLVLFMVYVVVVVWFRGRGVWAWLNTMAMLLMISTFLSVNLWAGQLLDWRFFRDRVVGIIMNVLAISLAYSITMVTVFNARNWFPFKIHAQNVPVRKLAPRALLVVWNLFVLSVLLFLCLIIWFSRLYTSWACVRTVEEVLLLCQFTPLVQCWPCADAAACAGVDVCIADGNTPYHCMSPLPMANGGVKSAFCVFNYNIGVFTIITVFAYVGGIYFFTRASLNGAVKSLRVLLFVAVQGARRLLRRPTAEPRPLTQATLGYSLSSEEESEGSDRDDELHLQDQHCQGLR